MKFSGKIEKVPCIDYLSYHRDRANLFHKIVLISDYEIENCFTFYAVVSGKFDDSFCDGANPKLITENGDSIVEAGIQISYDLLEKLEADKQTSLADLGVLRKVLDGSKVNK